MKDIFEALCDFYEDNSPASHKEREVCRLSKKLRKQLNPKNARLFSDYIDAEEALSEQFEKQDFKRGFTAGCNFLLNIIRENKV